MESSHVAALQAKHDGLDRQLRAELSRPSPDTAMIQSLKKRKLMIKQEIAHI
ncbi:MAG: YdcH family protein [Porphyrobacter sp.]|nr:YdcH family protein [Porphyrobacter sp.]